MPTLLFLIIAFFLLPGISGVALAESIVEIKQVKGVLLYGGSQHWLTLSYDYTGNESDQRSYSTHAFQESYNALFQAALFDPRIFDATLQGAIVFDQDRSRDDVSSSSSKNTSYQYNFSGSGLNKSPIPFTLLSYRTTNSVQNTYTTPTTNTNIGNEFGISFLNSRLQSRLQLARNSIDTEVGGTTSSSTSNSVSYAAEHLYGGFSTTSLTASFSDQNGSTSGGDTLTSSANSLSLSNALIFGGRQTYSLLSSFQLNNSTVDNLPQRSITFSEFFSVGLGRALTLDVNYLLTNNRSTDFERHIQENTINEGQIRLKHKLFESLFTELQGAATFNSMSDGTENRFSLLGSSVYTKKLPAGNRLSLGVSKGYDLVDRQVGTDMTTVRDELHTTVRQGDVIQLALANGSLRSITIASRNPIFTYVEGIDYTVNYQLGRITILSGGGVRIDMDGNGTDLYFTYTVYTDPQIKYSIDRLSLFSDLTLFNKYLTIGGAWSQSRQTLMSGPVSNSLQDSSSLSLFVSGSYDSYSGRVTYMKEDTGQLSYQSIEGSGSAGWQTTGAALSLTVRDTYSSYEGTLTSAAYSENSANLTLSYSRNILYNGKLTLQGTVNDLRSEQRPTKDSLSLRAKYQVFLNMITINLFGQTAWVIDSNVTTRNDSVHADFTRYF